MNVLVVGNCSIDEYLTLDSFPKEGTKSSIKDMFSFPGGSALVSSILLSKWEVETYLLSVISCDEEGKRLLDFARKNNVKTDHIIETTNKTLRNVYLVNGFFTSLISKSNIEENININMPFDIILGESLNYNLTQQAFDKFKNSIKILNLNSLEDNTYELCKKSDYIIIPKDSAELMTKTRILYEKPDTLKEVINTLENMFKSTIIITLGNKGSLYKIEDKIKIMGAIKVNDIDTTGAGDIFAASFAYGISKKLSLEKCLKIATIASGLSVKELGAINSIPNVLEVYKVYEKNK